jgi:hypothetical protein
MRRDVYIVTTVRLTPGQKRKLDGALKVIEGYRGRRLSRGEAVEALADFAMERRADLAQRTDEERPEWMDDPLLDPDFGFNFGRTDEKSVDRLVYGRR